MRRFLQWLFRIFPDQFRLDVGRIIEIDGHEFVIQGWTASESYTNAEEIVVSFKNKKEFEALRRLT